MADFDPNRILLSFPKGDPGPPGPRGPRGYTGPSGRDGSLFVPPRYTTLTRPVASSIYSGHIIRLKDENVPEKLQVCLENAYGAYEWITLAITSL
jgi:hypothetical protein